MMKSPRSLLAGLVLVTSLTAGHPARATVLFEHPFGDPNTDNVWCSSCLGFFRLFDQFTLTSAANITEIDARLGFRPAPDAIEYSIWDTTLTTQLFSQTFAIGDLVTTALGGTDFDVVATISGLNLAAGTYALSIFSPESDRRLGWWDNGNPGSSFQTLSGAGQDKQLSFRLLGDTATPVPEPSALALVGLALVGVGSLRKRSA